MSKPCLVSLVDRFYDEPAELGDFQRVEADQLPSKYAQLLAHHEHMTVTVEAFHQCPVDVEVLQDRLVGSRYERKILLRRSSDRAVVLFGLVNLETRFLDQPVRDEILAKQIPLGRVLINHNVMRLVRLADLWRVVCGPELAGHFGVPVGTTTYGRTAMIHFGPQPALELLEIVAP